MYDTELPERLQSFIESEGNSCSFDPELITPEYVYRMWGGCASLEEIKEAMADVRRKMLDDARREMDGSLSGSQVIH